MLAGVDRSILQFDTAAQLIAPVKHVCFTRIQWLLLSLVAVSPFFLATHTATVTLTRRSLLVHIDGP